MLHKIADNGDVEVCSVNYNGDVSEVPQKVKFETFYQSFIVTKGVKLADYPQEGPLNNSEWAMHEHRAKIALAIAIVSRHYGDADVMCRVGPTRAAVARRDFKAGDCVLVPTTNRCSFKAEFQESAFVCHGSFGESLSCALQPTTTMPCPAWFMQSSPDKGKANMRTDKVKVSASLTPFLGKGGAESKQMRETSMIEVPIFVNKKKVKEGDELIYHEPHSESNEGDKPKGKKRTINLVD